MAGQVAAALAILAAIDAMVALAIEPVAAAEALVGCKVDNCP